MRIDTAIQTHGPRSLTPSGEKKISSFMNRHGNPSSLSQPNQDVMVRHVNSGDDHRSPRPYAFTDILRVAPEIQNKQFQDLLEKDEKIEMIESALKALQKGQLNRAYLEEYYAAIVPQYKEKFQNLLPVEILKLPASKVPNDYLEFIFRYTMTSQVDADKVEYTKLLKNYRQSKGFSPKAMEQLTAIRQHPNELGLTEYKVGPRRTLGLPAQTPAKEVVKLIEQKYEEGVKKGLIHQ